VGGIGMNIMLVSVTGTKEIGLRQAVEAKTHDILSKFLVEAVTGVTLGIASYRISPNGLAQVRHDIDSFRLF
jgi:putative ABC transport system permease protein